MTKSEGDERQLEKLEESAYRAQSPITNRSCTDVLCLIIFLICILLFFGIGVYAILEGNPRFLLHPTDSNGTVCGLSKATEGKPFLLFFDVTQCATNEEVLFRFGCPTPQVCVKECPKAPWAWLSHALTEDLQRVGESGFKYEEQRKKMVCRVGVNPLTDTRSIRQLIWSDDCAPYLLPSEPVLDRCVPTFLTKVVKDPKSVFLAAEGFGASPKDADPSTAAIVAAAGVSVLANDSIMFSKYSNSTSQYITNNDITQGVDNLIKFLDVMSVGEKIFADIKSVWPYIMSSLVLTMIFSFIYIVLMRWIAGVIIWITIAFFLLLLIACTGLSVLKYHKLKNQNGTENMKYVLTLKFSYYFEIATTWLAISIICGSLTLICLLVLLALRKRIRIAIVLIKESSKAVSSIMTTLLWPIVPFLLQIAIFTFYLLAALHLASIARKPETSSNETTSTSILDELLNKTGCSRSELVSSSSSAADGPILLQLTSPAPLTAATNTSGFTNIMMARMAEVDKCKFLLKAKQLLTHEEYAKYLQIFLMFMTLWMVYFIVALGEMVLAGAFASWYWSTSTAGSKGKKLPSFPLLNSVGRTFRYHLGSVALGSFIIAFIKMIRIMLEYIERKLKKSNNDVARFVLKCLKCCFWCLEKFLKFLNRNAYIMTAVHGSSFCSSARRAFKYLLSNALRVAVLDKVADYLLFLGKLVTISASGALAVLYYSGYLSAKIDALEDYTVEVNYMVVPIAMSIIGAFFVSKVFFSVYEMAVDTLLLCFLEDEDINGDDSPFMPKSLRKILGTYRAGSADGGRSTNSFTDPSAAAPATEKLRD